MGQRYAGKGKVLYGDRLDFEAAAKTLEVAERLWPAMHSRRSVDLLQGTLQSSRLSECSRSESRTGSLLQEALEYAKPYGDRLDVPFAYAMLGRLAKPPARLIKRLNTCSYLSSQPREPVKIP